MLHMGQQLYFGVSNYYLENSWKNKTKSVTNLNNLLKLQIVEFWEELYMQRTFWTCLIR